VTFKYNSIWPIGLYFTSRTEYVLLVIAKNQTVKS